jgi:hypothetical protein
MSFDDSIDTARQALLTERGERTMRLALSLVALLFWFPANAWSEALLFTQFLNSDLSYGTGAPYQFGFDGEAILLNGVKLANHRSLTFEAVGADFVQQTVSTGPGGAVYASEYIYRGGTFRIDFELHSGGAPMYGAFVAPIVEMRVLTSEPEGSPDAWYWLGPGAFDVPTALALGIGTHSLGGFVFIDLIAPNSTNNFGLPAGDYMSPVRGAWDGYTMVDIELFEPPSVILSLLGVIAVWLRRFAAT